MRFFVMIIMQSPTVCSGETQMAGVLMISETRGLFRGSSLQDHFAGIIPFRDYADQIVVLHYQQGSHFLVGHLLYTVIDRGIGRGGPDIARFLAKNCIYLCCQLTHERTLLRKCFSEKARTAVQLSLSRCDLAKGPPDRFSEARVHQVS